MNRPNKKITPIIGAAIRQARIELGLTQQRVSEQVGLSVEVYGRYERGQTTPSVATLLALAKVLQTSSDVLLGIRQRPPSQVEHPDVLRIIRALEGVDNPRLKVIRSAVELMAGIGTQRKTPRRKG